MLPLFTLFFSYFFLFLLFFFSFINIIFLNSLLSFFILLPRDDLLRSVF